VLTVLNKYTTAWLAWAGLRLGLGLGLAWLAGLAWLGLAWLGLAWAWQAASLGLVLGCHLARPSLVQGFGTREFATILLILHPGGSGFSKGTRGFGNPVLNPNQTEFPVGYLNPRVLGDQARNKEPGAGISPGFLIPPGLAIGWTFGPTG